AMDEKWGTGGRLSQCGKLPDASCTDSGRRKQVQCHRYWPRRNNGNQYASCAGDRLGDRMALEDDIRAVLDKDLTAGKGTVSVTFRLTSMQIDAIIAVQKSVFMRV